MIPEKDYIEGLIYRLRIPPPATTGSDLLHLHEEAAQMLRLYKTAADAWSGMRHHHDATAQPIASLLPPKPTPAEVRAARLASGLSQPKMAELLGLASHRTIQAWEAGQNPVTAGLWALFLLTVGQHPSHAVRKFAVRSSQLVRVANPRNPNPERKSS